MSKTKAKNGIGDPSDVFNGVQSPNSKGNDDVLSPETIPGIHSDEAHLCQICDDIASGSHYGIWACEGCKAFFKRSLRGHVNYVCPSENRCTIDKRRRKCCQACRLAKCQLMGMRKGTRRERRRSKPTHPCVPPDASSPPMPPAVTIKQECNVSSSEEKAEPILPHPDPPLHEASTTTSTLTCTSTCDVESKCTQTTLDLSVIDELPYLKTLITNDFPKRLSRHVPQDPETEMNLMTSLISLADTELQDIIYWAKGLDGFSALSIEDRVYLLEECWMEILIWGVSWRSIASKGSFVAFSEDLIFDAEAFRLANLVEVGNSIRALSHHMGLVGITYEEFLIIRVLIVFKSGTSLLRSHAAIQHGRQMALDNLSLLCQRLGRSLGWMADVMTLLAEVRQNSIVSITHLMELNHEESIPIAVLIKELIMNRETHRRFPSPPQ